MCCLGLIWSQVLKILSLSDRKILFLWNISNPQGKFASSFCMPITKEFPFYFEAQCEAKAWLYYLYFLLRFFHCSQRNLQQHLSETRESSESFLQHCNKLLKIRQALLSQKRSLQFMLTLFACLTQNSLSVQWWHISYSSMLMLQFISDSGQAILMFCRSLVSGW